MTSNSQLKRKNIDLKMENENLLDLRFALMSDNRRLEAERDNLQTHLDLSAQAIDAVTEERDEARAWARRMKRERDEARKWARHFRWWSLRLGQIADIWSKKWYADCDQRKREKND